MKTIEVPSKTGELIAFEVQDEVSDHIQALRHKISLEYVEINPIKEVANALYDYMTFCGPGPRRDGMIIQKIQSLLMLLSKQ